MGISGHLVWMGISGKHLVWMGIILWGTWASCAAFDNREIHVLKRGNNSLVYDQVTTMAHRPAHFGPPIPSDGFRGVLVKAKPHGACGEVDPPPADPDMAWIAVIARGGCHCVEKVANAARAGYSAVIIHNVHNDEKAFEMRDEIGNTRVNISAVSVGYTEGRKLEDLYTHSADSRVVVEIYVNSLRTYIAHFIVPFSVIFVGFILICMFSKIKRTIIRLVQMCRTPQPDSTMELRERPFQKDEHHDTCSICLDHFKTGEKIRVLPCEHPYHRKCVDPWLMKHTPTCPMCKRSVLKSMFSINIEEAESHLDSMVEYIPVHDVQARPEDIASFHTESETSDSGNRRVAPEPNAGPTTPAHSSDRLGQRGRGNLQEGQGSLQGGQGSLQGGQGSLQEGQGSLQGGQGSLQGGQGSLQGGQGSLQEGQGSLQGGQGSLHHSQAVSTTAANSSVHHAQRSQGNHRTSTVSATASNPPNRPARRGRFYLTGPVGWDGVMTQGDLPWERPGSSPFSPRPAAARASRARGPGVEVTTQTDLRHHRIRLPSLRRMAREMDDLERQLATRLLHTTQQQSLEQQTMERSTIENPTMEQQSLEEQTSEQHTAGIQTMGQQTTDQATTAQQTTAQEATDEQTVLESDLLATLDRLERLVTRQQELAGLVTRQQRLEGLVTRQKELEGLVTRQK